PKHGLPEKRLDVNPIRPCNLYRKLRGLSFFFNDTATTEIYTLSLHDALPICLQWSSALAVSRTSVECSPRAATRSEEHTSELQSLTNLVCRLLLEKKTNM